MAYTFNGKANININNTGNSTFGNIKQPNTTGDYITNKKAKLLFDINSNKKRLGSLLNQTNLFLLKRAQLIKNIGICQSLPAFNSANLVSGLHSTENLTGINIITSVNDGSACPIYSGATLYPDLIIAKPIYYNYEVDKCGSLFGNNICGIENYNDYKIINKPVELSSQSLLDCYPNVTPSTINYGVLKNDFYNDKNVGSYSSTSSSSTLTILTSSITNTNTTSSLTTNDDVIELLSNKISWVKYDDVVSDNISMNMLLFTSVAVSSTGEYQTAVASGGGIWTSSNYSIIWNKYDNILTNNILWSSVSISESGQYQTAVAPGNGIWISSNYGIDWYNYDSATISVSIFGTSMRINTIISGKINIGQFVIGSNIVAGTKIDSGSGGIYYLNNSQSINGNMIISTLSNLSQYTWSSVSVSASGKYQTVVSNDAGIWCSINYGMTWTQYNNIITNGLYWKSVAVSGWNSDFVTSGKFQVAVSNGGGIWTSYNYGGKWHKYDNSSTNNLQWTSVCVSTSGKYKTAVANGGGIWIINENYINSVWVKYEDTNANNESWSSVTMSSSGRYQIALSLSGRIWISSNFGLSWSNSNSNSNNLLNGNIWSSISISDFGNYGTAVSNGGGLYRFFNSSVTADPFYNSAEFIGYIRENILTVTNVINGNLYVGQLLSSTKYFQNSLLYIKSNTYITSLGSSGGIGTYSINITQNTVKDASSVSIPITIYASFVDKTYLGVVITSTDLSRNLIVNSSIDSSMNQYGILTALNNSILNGSLYWDISQNSTNYGTMTIDNSGSWIYTLTNSLPVQQLKMGEIKIDLFTATVTNDYDDTYSKNMYITIVGINDPPIISGNNLGDISYNISTNVAFLTGNLTASDPDISGNFYWDISGSKLGKYGTIAISSGINAQKMTGQWRYDLSNNAAYKALRKDQTDSEIFYARVWDDLSACAIQQIIITVVGINDSPTIISGDISGSVLYNSAVVTSTVSSGILVAYDPDISNNKFRWDICGNNTKSDYGSIDISGGGDIQNSKGSWKYTLDYNSVAYKTLRQGSVYFDKFYARVLDDFSANAVQEITITVVGINDAPSDISGNTALTLTKGDLSMNGTFLAVDVDISGNFFWDISGSKTGKYGTIDISGINTNKATGSWKYDLSNNSTVYKQLRENETGVDTFTVRVWDDLSANYTKQITITVVGQNDPPEISGDISGSVLYNSAVVTSTVSSGILVAYDPDISNNKFRWDICGNNTKSDYGSIDISGGGDIQNSKGSWKYTLDYNSVAYKTLRQGSVYFDKFYARVLDDLSANAVQEIIITVVGINDAPSDISGNTALTLTKGDLSMNGTFVAYDIDLSGNFFWDISGSKTGKYGTIDISGINTNKATGSWKYVLNNNSSVYKQLRNNETDVDKFTIRVWDDLSANRTKQLTITVVGKNDDVVITGNTGSIIIHNIDDTNLFATNTLIASDIDLSGNFTWDISGSKTGNYGSITIDSSGNNGQYGIWTYTSNNDFSKIGSGATQYDTFITVVTDDLGLAHSTNIVVSISNLINVYFTTYEDTYIKITFNDIVSSAFGFNNGIDESFIITAVSADTYTLTLGSTVASAIPFDLTNNNNNKIDASTNAFWTSKPYANGDIPAFTIKSKNNLGDESSESVIISINVIPVNNPPEISSSSDISGNITTNQNVNSLNGNMFASDVDLSGILTWTVAAAANADGGNYGTMMIHPNTGVWVYNIDYTEMQRVNVGDVHRDRFIATVSDYLNASDTVFITIVITGGVNNIISFPTTVEDTSGVEITFNNILHSLVVSNSGVNFHNNGSVDSYIITAVSTDTYTLKLGLNEDVAEAFDLSYNEIDASTNAYWTPAANANGDLPAFTIISKNILGTESTESVTININVTPVNDQPVIILSLSDISGNITTNRNVTSLTGTLVASDIDLCGNLTWTVADAFGYVGGNYGTMTIDSSGVWVYDLSNNTVIQQLNVGETHTDVFTATVSEYLDMDSSANVDITIVITGGTNKVSEFDKIEEDSSGVVITFNNILHSQVVSNSGADFHNNGSVDSYIITAVSTDTYTLKLGLSEELAIAFDLSYNEIDDNTNAYWTPAANANGDLPAFTIISKNISGTESSESVTIKINVTPVNDPPVIILALSSDISRNITTNQGVTSLTGTLVASDVDLCGNLIWTVSDAATFAGSNYGTMTIDSHTGIWIYNYGYNTAIQHINVGDTHTDVFTATVSEYLDMDSSANVDITIVITGGVNNVLGFPGTVEDSSGGVVITHDNIFNRGFEFYNNGSINSYIITAVSTDTYTLKLGLTEELAEAFDLSYNEIDENINAYWTPAANANGELPAFTVNSKNTLGSESIVSAPINIIVTPDNDSPVIIPSLSDISGNISTIQSSVTGKLVTLDVDVSDNLTWSVNSNVRFIDSSYGRLSIDSSGNSSGLYRNWNWTYDICNNSMTQSLYAGNYATEVFSVKVTDSSGLSSDPQIITINVSGSGSIPSSSLTGYTWALQTNTLKTQNWYSVSVSNNGQYSVAVSKQPGYVYTSADYGVSWTRSDPSGVNVSGDWIACAISYDGSKIVVAQNGGYLYVSSNYGTSWVTSGSVVVNNWNAVSISDDGSKISAVASGSNIYTYNGTTWLLRLNDTSGNLFNVLNWSSITMSSDGSKSAACALSNYIYISADFGSTWKRITSAGSKSWTSIDMSSDGSKLAAVENNGYIYKSSDYGITWSQTTAPLGYWLSISMSSDGSKMAAVGNDITNKTYVYISYDFGISWVSQTSANLKLWNSVAISKDGLYIAAVSKNDYISVASYPEVFTMNSYINTNTVTTFQTINGKKNYVVQFYSNNTITMKQNIDVSYIIIGGGAGGILSTSSYGGGAGAGGSVLHGTTHLSVGNGYSVTIGNGGSIGVKGVDSSFNSIVASGGAIGIQQTGGVGVNGGGSGGTGSYSSNGNTVIATSGAAGATLPFQMNINGNTYTQLAIGGTGAAINTVYLNSTILNTGNGGGSSQAGGSGIVILYFSI